MIACFMFCLIWSLTEVVHSQTAPYVSFMGVNLPNHAYVDLTAVGNEFYNIGSGNTVKCHTDLTTCCTSMEGPFRGDWFFPDDNLVFVYANGGEIYKVSFAQEILLVRRNNSSSPTGMYRCEIATVADNDINIPFSGESIYVGMYLPNEGTVYHAITILIH